MGGTEGINYPVLIISMRQNVTIRFHLLILVLTVTVGALAQASPDWTEPFPPFHIAGNLYYVGSKGLAMYLVSTPQGNIVINSGLETNVAHDQGKYRKARIQI